MPAWTLNDIPDQSGRKVIVTGANTGIGFETARALARKGAHVTLACRSRDKGQQAVERILEETPDAAAAFEQLDLSDLRNVAAFAERYAVEHDRLDLLILNAGGKGIAINKKSGQVIWHSGAEKCGFATPVLYTHGGDIRIALLSRTDLYSIDPQTGNVH